MKRLQYWSVLFEQNRRDPPTYCLHRWTIECICFCTEMTHFACCFVVWWWLPLCPLGAFVAGAVWERQLLKCVHGLLVWTVLYFFFFFLERLSCQARSERTVWNGFDGVKCVGKIWTARCREKDSHSRHESSVFEKGENAQLQESLFFSILLPLWKRYLLFCFPWVLVIYEIISLRSVPLFGAKAMRLFHAMLFISLWL